MNLEIMSPMHILLVSILGHRETYSFVVESDNTFCHLSVMIYSEFLSAGW
jgi:hypothetical protein